MAVADGMGGHEDGATASAAVVDALASVGVAVSAADLLARVEDRPIRRMVTWFDQDGDDFVARPALVRLVSFRRNNLVADPPPYGQFDVILCRNVLLYFASATRKLVFDQLAGALRPGGVLILGAGETTIGQTDRFVPSQTFRGAYDLAQAKPPR